MTRRLITGVAFFFWGCASLSAQSVMPPAGAIPAAGQMQQPEPAAPAATPQNAKPLTLAEAEAIALKNNPQISVARLEALVAHQNVRVVRSAFFPTATLNITGVGADQGSRISAGALNNPVIYDRAASGVNVGAILTDFGRTASLTGSAEEQAKAEDQNSAATRAQILLAVDQAFYGSLEAQALLRVAQETVDSRALVAKKVGALTDAKLKSDLDLSFANVDLAKSRLQLLEAQNNLQDSLATLSAILGYPDLQNFDLVEEQAPLTAPPPDAAPLVAEGLQQRPEVAALRHELTASQKFSHAEHDLSRPTVSALGAVGLAPVRANQLTSWYGAAGVNISIPIFDGFQFDARAKSADLQADASRQRLVNLQNNVARDVRTSWQASRNAYDRLDVTKQLSDQANLALRLAQARYNLGLSSIIEFSQAELDKTEADITDTDARYQYRLSQIVLAFTLGRKF
ncbi:MAG: TolC family protein [Candidatus Acidiferrales bacterium]